MGNKKIFFFLLILISGCATGQVVKEEFEGPYRVISIIDGE